MIQQMGIKKGLVYMDSCMLNVHTREQQKKKNFHVANTSPSIILLNDFYHLVKLRISALCGLTLTGHQVLTKLLFHSYFSAGLWGGGKSDRNIMGQGKD